MAWSPCAQTPLMQQPVQFVGSQVVLFAWQKPPASNTNGRHVSPGLQIKQPPPLLPQNSPLVPGKHIAGIASPSDIVPIQQPPQFKGPHKDRATVHPTLPPHVPASHTWHGLPDQPQAALPGGSTHSPTSVQQPCRHVEGAHSPSGKNAPS